VVLDGGIRVSREAVVMVTPQFPRRPYTFLAWREVSPDKGANAAPASPENPVGR
jgi:hypothetical protein